MAIIDVVEWSPRSNDIYAWRYPETNLSTATQLIVRESQEAVFFSKGQILGKFGPGKHQLTTENLPLLRRLYGIPFGGKNPFYAEVWFVNRTMPLNIDWKTTPMRYMDLEYQAMVPVVARGRYGVKVTDAEKFLVKLIGTMNEFTSENLTDQFMGPLVSKTNSAVSTFMNANRVGITQISMQLDQLGTFLKEPMSDFWREYGLELTAFYVTSIDIDRSTDEGLKISEALSDRSAQNIAGYTWQQRQSFEVANNAMAGGNDLGLFGVAMLGGMFGNGGGFGQSLGQPPQQTGYGAGPGFGQPVAQQQPQGGNWARPSKRVFCANCARPFDSSSQFCPNCGHQYNPCPICGSDNQTNAHRCVSCGAQLQQSFDPMADVTCSRCGTRVRPNMKFCPTCGMRLG